METAVDEIIDIATNGWANASALITPSVQMKWKLILVMLSQNENNRAFMIAETKAFMDADTWQYCYYSGNF